MGGKGAGHKSVRALLSRQANIQKARAARRRPPLPWRSGMESRVIEQLVWQWYQDSGQWTVGSGQKNSDEWRVTSDEQAKAKNSGEWRVTSDEQAKAKNSGQWSVDSGEKRQMQIDRRSASAFGGAQNSSFGVLADTVNRATTMESEWADKSERTIQRQVLRRSAPPFDGGHSKRSEIQGDSGSRALRSAGQAGAASSASTSGKSALGSARIIARPQNRPWSKVRVARLLGVSHTWVNKLVKKFEADPEGMRRKMRAFAPANLEKLERAREETQRQRELGRLRGPIRWRRVKVKIQGRERKLPVPTREEMKKRKTLKEVASGEWLEVIS